MFCIRSSPFKKAVICMKIVSTDNLSNRDIITLIKTDNNNKTR